MVPNIVEGDLYKVYMGGDIFVAIAECIEWERSSGSIPTSGKFRPLILRKDDDGRSSVYNGHRWGMGLGLAETISYTDIMVYDYRFEPVLKTDLPLYIHDPGKTDYFDEYLKRL